jgi:hypothetical protein
MPRAKRATPAERRIYLNHIRRLQERNRVLGEMLAVERIARQSAWAWYMKRAQSRAWLLTDYMLLHAGKVGIVLLTILHLEADAKQ